MCRFGASTEVQKPQKGASRFHFMFRAPLRCIKRVENCRRASLVEHRSCVHLTPLPLGAGGSEGGGEAESGLERRRCQAAWKCGEMLDEVDGSGGSSKAFSLWEQEAWRAARATSLPQKSFCARQRTTAAARGRRHAPLRMPHVHGLWVHHLCTNVLITNRSSCVCIGLSRNLAASG